MWVVLVQRLNHDLGLYVVLVEDLQQNLCNVKSIVLDGHVQYHVLCGGEHTMVVWDIQEDIDQGQ
jgi:hypothetical protein